MDSVPTFYDALASSYDDLFVDWPATVRRQGEWLDRRLRAALGDRSADVLDAACGIGTQSLGLALRGHRVRAADVSPIAVERARREALALGVTIDASVADMRTLARDIGATFDAVVVFDNAIPHLLTSSDLASAVHAMRAVLRPGGFLIASMRDYDLLEAEQARASMPRVLGEGATQRIVFQVWEWDDDRITYRLRQFILRRDAERAWRANEYVTQYRAWRRDDVTRVFADAGFRDVQWQLPDEPDAFYQPVLSARA